MRTLRYIRLKFFRKFIRPLKHVDRRLEEFGANVVYDRLPKRTIFLRFFQWILSLFSRLFSSIVAFRHYLYNRRILKSQYLGCVVIAVGNLTVGGTGKTPVVEKIVRELAARGRKVAILSRGYRSKKLPFWRRVWNSCCGISTPPRIVSDGEKVLLDSEYAGDEPFMLASNLPGVVVLTDKNRVKSGHYAIRHFGCDTLVLDDGFQYLRLRGQLNVLLIDHSNPFGNEHLLPRGILREPVRHLSRASYIFLTKSSGNFHPRLDFFLKKYARKGTQILECCHAPRYLQTVNGTEKCALDTFHGRPIAIFSGIAIPESFEKILFSYGMKIVYRRHFPDHYRFSENDLAGLFEQAQLANAEAVITTEKDAVRLPESWIYPLPFYFLRIEIQILRGENAFESFIQRICR